MISIEGYRHNESHTRTSGPPEVDNPGVYNWFTKVGDFLSGIAVQRGPDEETLCVCAL